MWQHNYSLFFKKRKIEKKMKKKLPLTLDDKVDVFHNVDSEMETTNYSMHFLIKKGLCFQICYGMCTYKCHEKIYLRMKISCSTLHQTRQIFQKFISK